MHDDGRSWSFKPNDKYKSTHRLIQLLVDIVAKGGNFLLNVGPQPDGELPAEAWPRMQEIGAWMKVNGEAIYGTRPIAPYKDGNVSFTRKGSTVYAIYVAKGESDGMPQQISFSDLAAHGRLGSPHARRRRAAGMADRCGGQDHDRYSRRGAESIRPAAMRSPSSSHWLTDVRNSRGWVKGAGRNPCAIGRQDAKQRRRWGESRNKIGLSRSKTRKRITKARKYERTKRRKVAYSAKWSLVDRLRFSCFRTFVIT